MNIYTITAPKKENTINWGMLSQWENKIILKYQQQKMDFNSIPHNNLPQPCIFGEYNLKSTFIICSHLTSQRDFTDKQHKYIRLLSLKIDV